MLKVGEVHFGLTLCPLLAGSIFFFPVIVTPLILTHLCGGIFCRLDGHEIVVDQLWILIYDGPKFREISIRVLVIFKVAS